eukprot:5122578-Amphidinium_carterae.2
MRVQAPNLLKLLERRALINGETDEVIAAAAAMSCLMLAQRFPWIGVVLCARRMLGVHLRLGLLCAQVWLVFRAVLRQHGDSNTPRSKRASS